MGFGERMAARIMHVDWSEFRPFDEVEAVRAILLCTAVELVRQPPATSSPEDLVRRRAHLLGRWRREGGAMSFVSCGLVFTTMQGRTRATCNRRCGTSCGRRLCSRGDSERAACVGAVRSRADRGLRMWGLGLRQDSAHRRGLDISA